MDSNPLTILGAFDAVIHLLRTERDAFKGCDIEGAIQTLTKVKADYNARVIEYFKAEVQSTMTLASTVTTLLRQLPPNSDLQPLLLRLMDVVELPAPPTPPPSSTGPIPPGPWHAIQQQFSEALKMLNQAIEKK